jgi:hypothetical protein
MVRTNCVRGRGRLRAREWRVLVNVQTVVGEGGVFVSGCEVSGGGRVRARARRLYVVRAIAGGIVWCGALCERTL